MKNFPIIDAHCHIYPDKIAEKASQSTGKFYDLPVEYDGKISTLHRVAKEAGITHCVVQSVATKPEQVSSINHFIAESVAQSDGFMTGLGTLHPDSDNIKADVDELVSLGLHGVKLHPDIQGFKIDDYRCLKIYELCEVKLPILLHTGDNRFDLSNPNRLEPVLDIYENLTVVAAHFGGYTVWDDAKKLIPRYKNAYVDCSSCFFLMTDEEIIDCINTFGEDHVLFGTDYPMWKPRPEIDRLLSLGFSDKTYEKIFYLNAIKVFGIK